VRLSLLSVLEISIKHYTLYNNLFYHTSTQIRNREQWCNLVKQYENGLVWTVYLCHCSVYSSSSALKSDTDLSLAEIWGYNLHVRPPR
jgi:hypothetical protein